MLELVGVHYIQKYEFNDCEYSFDYYTIHLNGNGNIRVSHSVKKNLMLFMILDC